MHGHQQLSLFNAHYDERCFLPIHVYDTERSRRVAVVLRTVKTESGFEVRAHLRRIVRHIRQRWTSTRNTFRGDGHYARPEAMEWCEANRVDYVFGLPGSKPLAKKIDEGGRKRSRTERAVSNQTSRARLCRDPPQGQILEPRAARCRPHRSHPARARHPLRRHQRRIRRGRARVYDTLYCGRGQAEFLINLHKKQLASVRKCCRSAVCLKVRVVLHTAAYCGSCSPFATPSPNRAISPTPEFSTLRLRLIKIAARVIETASRVRLSLSPPAAPRPICSVALPGALSALGP